MKDIDLYNAVDPLVKREYQFQHDAALEELLCAG